MLLARDIDQARQYIAAYQDFYCYLYYAVDIRHQVYCLTKLSVSYCIGGECWSIKFSPRVHISNVHGIYAVGDLVNSLKDDLMSSWFEKSDRFLSEIEFLNILMESPYASGA